ncbi:MAG: hypothetical protein IJF08_02375 [Clostridia bacterium]|nr:hypothetical protein [Clostridia bacterium]
MHELDIYYRALRELRRQTATDDKCRRFTDAVKHASDEGDCLRAQRTICHIDEDWVYYIETHLPYVEKAIKEERQFIRREGETVDIGKAKKVSRDSVEHLARHSEMITHLPEEGEMLIPDKIYITENTSNYTVYENRFLYLLLTFMSDFVEMRYSKIAELGNTYKADLTTHKRVVMGKRSVEMELHFCEQAKNDPYADKNDRHNTMLQRVEAIRVITNMLLMTPLMKEVAKAPLISPPITRTNVLRMDNNFKYAVELYDYLVAYAKDGYTIEYRNVEQEPFDDALESEIDEMVAIMSYLTYKHGSGAAKTLEQRYIAAEREQQQAAEEARRARLEMLRQRAHESSASMDEYLLALEEQNRMLERHAEQMRAATETLQKAIDQEAQKLSAVYFEQCERRFREKREALIASYEKKLETKEMALEMSAQEQAGLLAENQGLQARVRALQYRVGETPVEDTTTKEYIEQLEREYGWYVQMFEKNWKLTKRKIRKDILWSSDKKKKSDEL